MKFIYNFRLIGMKEKIRRVDICNVQVWKMVKWMGISEFKIILIVVF